MNYPIYKEKIWPAYKCPTYETQSWVQGPPLLQQRVALISTAVADDLKAFYTETVTTQGRTDNSHQRSTRRLVHK